MFFFWTQIVPQEMSFDGEVPYAMRTPSIENFKIAASQSVRGIIINLATYYGVNLQGQMFKVNRSIVVTSPFIL